jgi:hypothetical protein
MPEPIASGSGVPFGVFLGSPTRRATLVPSFETLGLSVETAYPFTLWPQAAQLMCAPWLLAAQTMMLRNGRTRTLPGVGRTRARAADG